MKENTEWLTNTEARNYLKIKSRTTLDTIVKRYGIRQAKLLSLTYISRSDIDRALAENSAQSKPAYSSIKTNGVRN